MISIASMMIKLDIKINIKDYFEEVGWVYSFTLSLFMFEIEHIYAKALLYFCPSYTKHCHALNNIDIVAKLFLLFFEHFRITLILLGSRQQGTSEHLLKFLTTVVVFIYILLNFDFTLCVPLPRKFCIVLNMLNKRCEEMFSIKCIKNSCAI